jgi:hypothetical protein
METVLGLLALALYIAAIIALAAGVTYVVVRLTPDRAKKPRDDASAG